MPFFNFEADTVYGVDLAETFMELLDFDSMLWGGQFVGLVRGVTNWTLKDGVLSSRNLNLGFRGLVFVFSAERTAGGGRG